MGNAELQCLLLRHFQTEVWGAGETLRVFSSHSPLCPIASVDSSVPAADGRDEEGSSQTPTEGLGEAHTSSLGLSLILGHPSHFLVRCLKLLLGGNCQ